LELQEELSDVKWELGAREKGADYVSLLKDRKERNNQLNKTRRALKEAEEKILDLERQMQDHLSSKKDLEKEIVTLSNTEGNAEQIAGLKRQIKSLKAHNATLERKLDTQSRDSEDVLVEKQAKIQILEYELHKIRNEPQQTVRGAVSGFITGFGRKNNEGESNSAHGRPNAGSNTIEGIGSPEMSAANESGKSGNLWGIFGQRGNRPDEQNLSNGIDGDFDENEAL